jgi:hypothetical protein
VVTTLSTTPAVVDIHAYGGDTLTIHVKIAAELIGGRTFFAHVRSTRESTKLDAAFGVVLTAEGADIVLLAADARRLSQRGDYEGFWDVQLAMADGLDPVTTLAFGELWLYTDVTRVPV